MTRPCADHPAMPVWLVGSWIEQTPVRRCDELWTDDAHGNMIGVFRWIEGGHVRMYELMVLTRDEGRLFLHLKHFGPDLVGWEAKDDSEVFACTESTDRRFRCVSVSDARRVSIDYARPSSDEIVVTVHPEEKAEQPPLVFRFLRSSGRAPEDEGEGNDV